MLSLEQIRNEPDVVRAALVRRAEDEDCLDEILTLDARRRAAITEGDELRSRRNQVSREIGRARSQGGPPPEDVVAEMRQVGQRISELEDDVRDLDARLNDAMLALPNLPDASTPDGQVYYASLAGSYIGRIDLETGQTTVLDPPTSGQGARRVWSDSQGRIWVSEWNTGQVTVYEPNTGRWQEWRLPGERPRAYAVYVDEQDIVWLSDFGGNALVRFDPATEEFRVFPLPSSPGNVRQILGRPGEVWGAESAADTLVVIRTAAAP